jgi:signal transduction histidine kinase
LSRRGKPEPVDDNGREPRSSGVADVGGVRRVGRDGGSGTGQRDPTVGTTVRGDRRGLVDFGVLALTSRLDAARRAVAAGDAERERIGKDLHDGVQQRLTALRIRLALAAEGFEARGDEEASAALNDVSDEVDQAIDELRAFAHRVYPELLTSGGLIAALASAGRRAPESVTVLASGVRRYPPEIEAAVYFSCLAAMDNAAKHAGRAHVTVRVWADAEALRFTIRDSGHGFDPLRATPGAGITNMRDRIAAVGGSLTVDSTPAHGTVVQGNVPHPSYDPAKGP